MAQPCTCNNKTKLLVKPKPTKVLAKKQQQQANLEKTTNPKRKWCRSQDSDEDSLDPDDEESDEDSEEPVAKKAKKRKQVYLQEVEVVEDDVEPPQEDVEVASVDDSDVSYDI